MNEVETANDAEAEDNIFNRRTSKYGVLYGLPFGMLLLGLVWWFFCPWLVPQWGIILTLLIGLTSLFFDLVTWLKPSTLGEATSGKSLVTRDD